MRSARSLDYSTSFARIAIAVLLCGALIGCRTGQKSSMVQVQEDPGAASAVPQPQQRLATTPYSKGHPGDLASTVTAKTQQKSAGTDAKRALLSSGKIPGQSDLLPPPPSETESEAPKPEQVSSRKTAASYRGKISDLAPVKLDAEPAVASTDEKEDVTLGSLVSASLTDLTEPEPAREPTPEAKIADAPADNAVAVTTETMGTSESSPGAPSTRSPRGLEDALRSSLASLPTLPQIDHRAVRQPTRRLGVPTEDVKVAASDSLPRAGTIALPTGEIPAGETPTARPAMEEMVVSTELPPITSQDSVAKPEAHVVPASHAGARDNTSTRTAHAVVARLEDQPAAVEISQAVPRELSENELFEQLLVRLSQTTENETPAERERRLIVTRHLMVLAGQPDKATETFDGLSEADSRYLKNHLMGLWTMIDPEGHPSSGRRITEALPKFREATRHMAAATDSLSLSNLEFCTEIESYGQIKPFEGNRFAAGQQVILYCEVENFGAAENGGSYLTQLRGSYDVYDSGGTKVVSQLLPVDQQQSRNHLRDYFLAYQMNLPNQLETGTYRLQLTIEDVIGKKYGQSEIPFEIK